MVILRLLGLRLLFFYVMIFLSFFADDVYGQLFGAANKSDRGDSLRGTLSPERSCFDVYYYHLDLRIDTGAKSIRGYNDVYFKVVNESGFMQLDLYKNMEVRKIVLDDSLEVSFSREYNAIFVSYNFKLLPNSLHHLTVYYGGIPTVGKMLPWDGGFKWTQDKDGNTWIAVACQGAGASLWWPNKDHQSDEPDSMLISIAIPSGLTEVSNGRLRGKKELRGGFTRYDWFVSAPINNYNVTLNIGNYSHFREYFQSGADSLSLDYYVLPANLEKAKIHFAQVNKMLSCFEHYFGKYPFYKDGFKLVETPYLGMEHQSCIAYGNKYKTGYSGIDRSGSGLDFDYIIIHESAHEWWGNAITTKDIADMWVHEGFGTYAEVLYVECMYDSARAAAYVKRQMQNIRNDKPVIGFYGINNEGSGDMYSKGMALLNTLRHVIHNDSLWFSILIGLQDEYRYKTVTSKQIESFISIHSGRSLESIFEQYLRTTDVPVLEIHQVGENVMEYKWTGTKPEFSMPIWIQTEPGLSKAIIPSGAWQSVNLTLPAKEVLKDIDILYYIRIKWN